MQRWRSDDHSHLISLWEKRASNKSGRCSCNTVRQLIGSQALSRFTLCGGLDFRSRSGSAGQHTLTHSAITKVWAQFPCHFLGNGTSFVVYLIYLRYGRSPSLHLFTSLCVFPAVVILFVPGAAAFLSVR